MRVVLAVVLLLLCWGSAANTLRIQLPGQPAIAYDFVQLAQMPATEYVTGGPWYKGQAHFTGVLLSALLKQAAGEIPEQIKLTALNDYSVVVRRADIEAYQPIIAYLRDGKPMRVRHKGPYWLIYPLASFPHIDNVDYHSQMIWQLETIQISEAE